MNGSVKKIFYAVTITFALSWMCGCAEKKPLRYRFQNCKITEDRKCDCLDGIFIGYDAKTQTRIIDCRGGQ